MTNQDERRAQARERIKEERGFYGHLLVYIFVNIFLAILNFMTAPDHLWFYWSLLGWGIGLIAHGVGVFGPRAFPGKKWEERRMKKLMGEDE